MSRASIGIDLGTTYSLVATLVAGKPTVLQNALGEGLTPSAVHVDDSGHVLVGSAARERAATDPGRTALSFKRDMGTLRRYQLGGRSFSPEELSALVLAQVKMDAEAALGESITEAVVTVPAYFGELQRRATQNAAEMAGLRVERMINEPTAAALAYGLHQQHRELKALVLDLGGGTFDVTVLEILEGVIEIQSSAGNARLGGDDFSDAIVKHCESLLAKDGIKLATGSLGEARLRAACEVAKRRLTSDEQARVVLPRLPTSTGERDVELVLDRTRVEELYQPLLAQMLGPIQRALRDANKAVGEIDEVLLVGGATRMPSVVRLASDVFGRLPLRTLPPDEAVALGAAVQAALKSGDSAVGDIVVTDVAPFSLGIASGADVGGTRVTGLFSPILERGTVLPASRVSRFHTMGDNQRELKIEVFQGEHSHCDQNQKLGEYTLKGIPAKPAGEESVDVRFSYDLNGVLDVDATVVSTKKAVSFTLERVKGQLSSREIAETRQRLARLKFHPREALPNLTALSRAEALHVELTGAARAHLNEALVYFRAALESQDPQQITRTRELLLARLNDLRAAP
ncbi:MAG TPA: Hsp70 family protein [Polyangiaceae bacterium]|nr:Hsp70 family protein [Polyangiaceae bacterium]